MKRDAFYSIAAQADNLGDIAIRQVPLDWFGQSVGKFVIFTGHMPKAYVDAFEFPTGTLLITSRKEFLRRLLQSVWRRRAHLIFAPGPSRLRSGGRPVMKSLGNLIMVLIVRASGGRVLSLGRAIRGRARSTRFIERLSIRLTSLFVSRDTTSGQSVSLTLRNAPDLGFWRSEVSPTEEERTLAAISLRSDRGINESLLAEVINQTREAGLTPIFVTQVKRDDANHAASASRYSALHCSWTSEAHRDQLQRVEHVYARSRTVVSNRLHALILGLNQGAVPVALEHAGNDKLSSTLGHHLQMSYEDPAGDTLSDDFPLVFTDTRRAEVMEAAHIAHSSLTELREEALELLAGR